jgi:hypothetical protein
MSVKQGYLSDFFDGFAVKRLTSVEITPSKSNQHEFQGIQRLREILGTPSKKVTFKTKFIWLDDEGRQDSVESFATWSDVRRANPDRSPEYHLYYSAASAEVVHRAKPGDLLLVCKRKSAELVVVIAPAQSTTEKQLAWLFNFPLDKGGKPFVQGFEKEPGKEISFAARFILDDLGIEDSKPDAQLLDLLIEKFGNKFPSTMEFSTLARESLSDVSANDNPDAVLMAWLEREEQLFRTFESHIVAERLKEGFHDGKKADVENFIKFSLSVQNRRKARAGYALENHLEPLLSARKIRFVRGGRTEHHAKPDFLFPGEKEYQNTSFPDDLLSILGAKSSCKDRWRQVLSEASRVKTKHLLTLEPGISENQTDEMQGSRLQLVVPQGLHGSYTSKQQEWLFSLKDFIDLVLKKEKA